MPETKEDSRSARKLEDRLECSKSSLELKNVVTSRTLNTVTSGTFKKSHRDFTTRSVGAMTPRTLEACRRCGVSPSEISLENMELSNSAVEKLKKEGRSDAAIDFIGAHMKNRRSALIDYVREERNNIVKNKEESLRLESQFYQHSAGGSSGCSPGRSVVNDSDDEGELDGVAGNLVAFEKRRMQQAKEKLEMEMERHLHNEIEKAEKERQQKIKEHNLEMARRKQVAEIDAKRRDEAAKRRREDERRKREDELRYEEKQKEIKRQLAIEREKEMALALQREQELQALHEKEREKERIMDQRQKDLELKHQREEAEMLEKLRDMEERERYREEKLEEHKARLRAQAEERAKQHAERMKQVRERDAEQVRQKREAFDRKQAENRKKAEEQERERLRMLKERAKQREAKEKQIQAALRQAEKQEEDRINRIINDNEERERQARAIRQANAEADELKILQQEIHQKEKVAAIHRKKRADDHKRKLFWEKKERDDEKMKKMENSRKQLMKERQDIRRNVMIQKHTLSDEMDTLRITNNFDALKNLVTQKTQNDSQPEEA